MTNLTHKTIFDWMEKWAPRHLAYEWDSVGMQIGSLDDITSNILVTLDVTEAIVTEAIEKDVNLIIAHHPILFKPLQKLDVASQKGKIIQMLIKNDITVYAAHTNLDIAKGGVNDILAEKLQLQDTSPLVETGSETLLKLVVFVPNTHTEVVRNGLGDAGAGFIGEYSHCTFKTLGTGTFYPQEGTDPYLGKQNELTFVDEDRLETVIKEKDTTRILHALKELHPYEEVAYDLYPVRQTSGTFGLGRVGNLPEATRLEHLCEKVKKAFQMDHLRFVGSKDKMVEKIAIIGGSGGNYTGAALKADADVLITGDVSFHPAQDADETGLSIIDPGHYIEKLMKDAVKQYLEIEFPDIPVFKSDVNTDPFNFM